MFLFSQKFHECLPGKHVISASHISNNRIALYMSSREDIAIAKGMMYGNSFLKITPLAQPTTRLTLSNVYPEVPNSALLEKHLVFVFCCTVYTTC